MKGDLG